MAFRINTEYKTEFKGGSGGRSYAPSGAKRNDDDGWDGQHNYSSCPLSGHMTYTHAPAVPKEKTFSTYFVSLRQWKITRLCYY